MSSEKRDLSNLLKYEGRVNNKKNLYEFPQLYNISKNGKIRIWKISIRLIKDPDKKRNKIINWNILEDEQLPIEIEYVSGRKKLPPFTIAQYWVITGEMNGKKTRHPPSYGELKNKDRENERNALQTAIIASRNEYLKKIQHGFKKNIKDIKRNSIDVSKDTKKQSNLRYFPMLPVKYKERYEKIEYPCYVQPKLDGTRTVAFLGTAIAIAGTDEEVILYSRELKDVPGKKKIKEQLLPILKKMYDYENNESLYIDFEFYKFGKKLQDISSEFRSDDVKACVGVNSSQCWIFDAFYPSKLNTLFIERIKYIDKIFVGLKITNTTKLPINKNSIIKNYEKYLSRLEKQVKRLEQNDDTKKNLKKLFKKEAGIGSLKDAKKLKKDLISYIGTAIGTDGDETPAIAIAGNASTEIVEKDNNCLKNICIPVYDNLVKVPTIKAVDRIEEEYLYRAMLVVNFEGSIVRNTKGIYKADPNTKNSYLRSMDVQKRKVKFVEEYPIENYTQGKKGRDKGALIWILTTKNKLFNAPPKNVTIKERKDLFSKFEKDIKLFEKQYKGKLMMVEFEDLSKDGIPQRLKSIGLRPYL